MNTQTLSQSIIKSISYAGIATAFLLAVLGGIFTLTQSASAATPKAPDTKSSYMLLYSDKGKYSKAYIVSTGSGKCNNKAITSTKGVSVGLSKSKKKDGTYLGVKIKCDPGSYRVFFLKKGDKVTTNIGATTRYAAVNVTESYCAFVHKKGTTRNEAVQANNRCTGDDDPNEDTVEKYTPVVVYSSNPGNVVQGKKFTTLVELKNPSGEPMSPEECAISFTTSKTIAGLNKKNNIAEIPFKYNSKTKSCTYKSNTSSSTSKSASSQIFTIKTNGNAYTNATSAEGRLTVVQDPAVAAKANQKEAKAAEKKAATERKKRGNSATKKAKITSAKVTKTQANAVSFRAEVTGVDDCNRINPSLDAIVKKKSKSNKKVIGGENPRITISQEGTTCVLTSNISYAVMPKSNVSYKLTFKAGTKQIKKTTNKVELEN